MDLHPIIALASTIAVLLIIASGFCIMVGATRIAGRLFLIALGIVVVPPLAFGILANIHNSLLHATDGNMVTTMALVLVVIGLSVIVWFTIRLKIIHLVQNWVVPRFGAAVDGDVTGTHLGHFLASVFSTLKVLAVVIVVAAILFLWW